MRFSNGLRLALLSLSISSALALILPAEKRKVPRSKLLPRSSQGFSASVTNDEDSQYFVDITIGGSDFSVIIDTGSADLWIVADKPISGASPANVDSGLGYLDGSNVSGPVFFAPVSMGQYSVPLQAFINANETNGMESILDIGADGLMGFGFSTTSGSNIERDLSAALGPNAVSSRGRDFVTNVFAQDPSTPNYFTVLLGRQDDLEDTGSGIFTISEPVEGLESVTDQISLPRYLVTNDSLDWAVLVDGVSVDGDLLSLKSSVDGVPKHTMLSILDTGTSLALVPSWLADAIYAPIDGSFYVNDTGEWVVPCTAIPPNVTFTYGGSKYPVHPLDLTTINNLTIDGTDGLYCSGAYQGADDLDGSDALLGDSFLRGVYALFDLGNADQFTNDNITGSFIQLLSLVPPNQSLEEFRESRPKNVDERGTEFSIDALQQYFSSDDSSNDDSDDSDDDKHSSNLSSKLSSDSSSSSGGVTDKYGLAIVGLLAGNLLVGVILCGIALSFCIRRGGKSVSRSVNPSYAPVQFREAAPRAEDEVYPTKYND